MSRRVVGIGLLVLAAMVGLFAIRPAFMDRLELNLLDWRFRLRGELEARAPVVIVAIDAKSLDEFGRWPWRRSVIARLIDRLSDAGASAIGVDLVFSEPEEPPEVAPLRAVLDVLAEREASASLAAAALEGALRTADTDRLLEESIARSERTALGFFFRTGVDEGEPGLPREPLEAQARRVRRSQLVVRGDPPAGSAPPVLTCTGVEPTLPRFNDAARRLGFLNALKDADGGVRRAALVASCAGALYPALSLATLEVATGRRAVAQWGAHGLEAIRLGEWLIPVDEGGRVLVNYLGRPGRFPHYPASDVVLGRIDDALLEGTIAIIGPTEVGQRDLHASPFSPVAPGVEVHASLIENVVAGRVLHRGDDLVLAELGALLAGGLLTALLVPAVGNALVGALIALVLLGLLAGGAIFAFLEHGVWFNLAYPGSTVLAVYLAVLVIQTRAEQQQRRWIRDNFEHFVPPDVVNEMIEHPKSFALGGERLDLSLLFSDIRDFTTIAEELGPEDTTRLLNAYLSPMTRIVFESRGTLDKYVGDAIVAFWGAPLPVPDHPLRAAEAALAMQEGLVRLREEQPGLPALEHVRIGIGVHSAEVNVGMMGSEVRFQYTVSGDGVNLCSRMEGLTKQYGAGVIASQDLVERLPPGFLHRELDAIRVKGRRQAVRIHEILGRREARPDEKGWLEAWTAGLAAYRAGRFAEARRALCEARELRAGGDAACDLLLERLARLEAEPPAGWDGIWTFETK